jgi:DNA-binding transcriptional ArsR family regulator
MSSIPIIADDADVEEAALCLKSMSHPLRLKILCILGNNTLSVLDIVEKVGTSQSNISQHLGVLRGRGILATRKDANKVFYFIRDPGTIRLIQLLKELFCEASLETSPDPESFHSPKTLNKP